MSPFSALFNAPTVRRPRWATVLLLILAVGAIAGCSDDDKPTGPGGGATTSGFTGLFVTGAASGKLTLTINGVNLAGRFHPLRASRAGAHEITASATITPTGGSAINLFGIYSDENDSLHIAGGNYVLIGHYDNSESPPSITGSVSSPGGDGIFGCFLGNSSEIKIYTGTYASTAGSATGSWNMVSRDTSLVGIAFPTGGTPNELITFDGTIERTGTTRAITIVGGEPGVFALTGTGTFDTATGEVSGTWVLNNVDDLLDDSGTWDGTLRP